MHGSGPQSVQFYFPDLQLPAFGTQVSIVKVRSVASTIEDQV